MTDLEFNVSFQDFLLEYSVFFYAFLHHIPNYAILFL